MFTPDLAFLDPYRADGRLPDGYPSNLRRLYAPRDQVHRALIALVDCVRTSLVIGMFGLTDAELWVRITEKLDDPSVYCQISLDRTQFAGPGERKLIGPYLDSHHLNNNISIGSSEHGAFSHDKEAVLDGIIVLSGSTNWTRTAEDKQNNVLDVISDPIVANETRVRLDLMHTQMLGQMAQRGGA